LSVAIRTMSLGANAGGHRAAELGVGAGIVLDSDAESELAKCRLKAGFATALTAGLDPSPTEEDGPHVDSRPAEGRQSSELSVV
jgi:para-aminobenzoate synthetase/4-amino-4-deoxychorismate lyase